MLVGLTGKNGAGKGEVAKFLTRRSFSYLSLGDEVRAEVRRRAEALTRETLIRVGKELRAQVGPGVLAERVLARLEQDRNTVIDSIRSPAEIEALRRRSDFVLLAIDAALETRFARVRERDRENDPKTLLEFQRLEAEENREEDASQQVARAMQLADVVIENNGTLEELHQRVKAVLQSNLRAEVRPDWDSYFMSIAQVVALRSNCMKRKVAAVIVKDRRIISTGYNGTPRGVKNCNEGGCPRCNDFAPEGSGLAECLCSHGEENAITQAAYHGVSIKGGVLYSTYSPCLLCTKMIINSGIQSVVYNRDYGLSETSLRILGDAGIEVRQMPIGAPASPDELPQDL